MLKNQSSCTRLPDDLREKIERYAEENDITIAQILRKAVKQFFANLEKGELNERI